MLPTVLLLLFSLGLAGCGAYVATSDRVVIRDDRAVTQVRFTDRDRSAVLQYYRTHKTSIRRTTQAVVKGGALPQDLRGEVLPQALESRLSVLPGSHTRIVVGRDLVIIDRHTRVVRDVLSGVVE